MKYPLRKIMLLAASWAIVATTAHAQFSGTYTQGDFLLGFHATGGTGSGNDVLVDLGPINFSNQTTFSTPNLDALLMSNFGSGWFTRSDLLYGSASGAQSGDANQNTVYGTATETLGGSESTAFPRPSSSQANQVKGKINAEGASYQNGAPTVANPAILQTTGSINSYASYQPGGTTQNSNGISYAYFNPSVEASNPSLTTLDVYQGLPGTGTMVDVGDLTVSSSGVVTFTPDSFEAVPEPSTYTAASLAVLGLVFFHLRRRTVKARSIN
jgi:hypothetical protein